jgi:hypothetical protein
MLPSQAGVAAGYGIMDEHFSQIGTREIFPPARLSA